MELRHPLPPAADPALGQEAFARRLAEFGRDVVFSAPSFKRYRAGELQASGSPRFVAVSVTGRSCALRCDHCRGRLLHSMHSAPTPEALWELAQRLQDRGCRGLLLSGGCDARGQVPLLPFLKVVDRLRRRLQLRVAVHPGLADANLACALADCGVDRVMIDLVGDPDTVRSVLHLQAHPDDFERSLALLSEQGLPVVPHLVVGLHRGQLRGEGRALAMIQRHRVAAAVMVVMRPEAQTPFARLPPPAPAQVGALMVAARLGLPRTSWYLGCARPVGRPSRKLERHALRAGFNGVAFPADETVVLARELGLRVRFEEQCCAL